MSSKPEPLAAILAEMRGIADNMETAAKRFDLEHRQDDRCRKHPNCFRHDDLMRDVNGLRDWADRIEAAVERERDEDRQLAAIAESDEAFARCARCDRPERAPGNAAAMRAVIEELAAIHDVDDEYSCDGQNLLAFASQARAAIASPARNCDKFATANDAVEGYIAAHPHDDEPDASTYGSWLFAPVQEGKEARRG